MSRSLVAASAALARRQPRIRTTYTGRIISVPDGDTLTMQVAGGRRISVRFSDIDTPETNHPSQPGGTAAGQSLSEMALNKNAGALCYGDRTFGREVCYVFGGDVNLNLEQVRRGWAWANGQDPSYMRDPENTTRAEHEARQARRGICRPANPIPPWVWRQRCWRENDCSGAGV